MYPCGGAAVELIELVVLSLTERAGSLRKRRLGAKSLAPSATKCMARALSRGLPLRRWGWVGGNEREANRKHAKPGKHPSRLCVMKKCQIRDINANGLLEGTRAKRLLFCIFR
jgi:hypothetical protein